MIEFFQIMTLPFLACLVLTGIHAYLGFHVIERQVIFVDLALAQIAVLGASLAIVLGYRLDSTQAYWMSLGFTVVGASIFSLMRFRKERVPQEAIIAIVYAVSAAAMILVLSRSGEGDEHIRQSLSGNILLVTMPEVIKIAAIYALVGLVHFLFRRQFFLVSKGYQDALQKGLSVRGWDFLFYVTFGVVVTSSVKIAGVLLVLAYLIVPPVCAMILSPSIQTRLILGWAIGFLVSVLGIGFSYFFDFPTAASIVFVFGLAAAVLTVFKKILEKVF